MVLALGSFGLNACGGGDFDSTCTDACSEKDCDGNAPSSDETASCKTTCDKVSTLNKAASCESKADDYASCVDDNKSKQCDANFDDSVCDTKFNAYEKCLSDFCTANQSNSACTGLTG